MVRRKEMVASETKPAPFNGVGEITVRSLLEGPAEMYEKGRVFAHTTVYPGSKIGVHQHKGDADLDKRAFFAKSVKNALFCYQKTPRLTRGDAGMVFLMPG